MNRNVGCFVLLLLMLGLFGCKKSSPPNEIKGVSVNIPADQVVWTPTNEWNAAYELKYQKWLSEHLELNSLGKTLLYQKYVKPIEAHISSLYNREVVLDCADNVLFFRAQFAMENSLPFMVTVSPYKNRKDWWMVGHFGFRSSSNYQQDDKSQVKVSYRRFKDSASRFAAFIWDINNNFGVVSFSSASGNHGDVYDIYPSQVRGGDIFIQANYGQGGHSLTLGRIDLKTPPFLTGYSYNKRENMISLLSDRYHLVKGGGLKRWKWAVKTKAQNGKPIWVNQVQTGDRIYYGDYTKEMTVGSSGTVLGDGNSPNRLEGFRDHIISQILQQSKSMLPIFTGLNEKIKKQMKGFINGPSSCNSRSRIPKEIEESIQLGVLLEKEAPMEEQKSVQIALNNLKFNYGLWKALFYDLFPTQDYYKSALCGWNSSNIKLFFKVMENNRSFIQKQLGFLAAQYPSAFQQFIKSNESQAPTLEDFYKAMEIYSLYQTVPSTDLRLDNKVDKFSKAINISQGHLSYQRLGSGYYSGEGIRFNITPLDGQNICFYVPKSDQSPLQWSADETFLKENKNLWPDCYR